MSTVTETPKKARKPRTKAAKKAVKKSPKKGAKKSAKKTERKERGPSKLQVEVLKVLEKAGHPMTRSEISAKLKDSFIGGTLMGHRHKEKLVPGSLVGRGLVKFGADNQDTGGTTYVILSAGKKAIENHKA
jgi:hypothetical protein